MNKETLLFIMMLICLYILSFCMQKVGYRFAERDILRSCITNNGFTIDDIKLICVKCNNPVKVNK